MILHNFCMSLNIHIHKIYTNHNVVLTCGKSEISTRFKECKYCCVQLLTYACTALNLTTNITTGKCCPHTSRCIIMSAHGILMFNILSKFLCYTTKFQNTLSILKLVTIDIFVLSVYRWQHYKIIFKSYVFLKVSKGLIVLLHTTIKNVKNIKIN